MIIATTVAITTMTTKESHEKLQIRSEGTNTIVPTFLISDLSPPTHLHYCNHYHHHYHNFYYFYYHYNTNKYLCLRLNTYIHNNKRTSEKKSRTNIVLCMLMKI